MTFSKHCAFVIMEGANVPTDKYDPRSETRYVKFDEPKRKMIASGSAEHCQRSLDKYLSSHPDRTGAVIEVDKPGDPWERDWIGVFS